MSSGSLFSLNIIGVFVILKMPGHFETNNSCCVCKGASGIMSQLSAIGSCKCKRVEVIVLVSLLSFLCVQCIPTEHGQVCLYLFCREGRCLMGMLMG